MKTAKSLVVGGLFSVGLMLTGIFLVHYTTQLKEDKLFKKLNNIDSQINKLEGELANYAVIRL